ncbi:hypothetical protein T4B_802 [Trichinella pseudospiralis]|uniref:Netrin receptor UNC5A-D-like N-terminal domain-containing protein n=1 Tax=Trichinella pseudospiralis TaxID=6337 RepID=A0A0V1JF24_TRIPS|nr:hypothetical protein T4B_802 [Trichinella pseudospiralis]
MDDVGSATTSATDVQLPLKPILLQAPEDSYIVRGRQPHQQNALLTCKALYAERIKFKCNGIWVKFQVPFGWIISTPTLGRDPSAGADFHILSIWYKLTVAPFSDVLLISRKNGQQFISSYTNSIESHLRLIVPSKLLPLHLDCLPMNNEYNSDPIPETEYERREGIDSTSNTPFLQTSIIVNRHSVDRIRSFSGEYSCECIAYGTGPEDKAEQVKSMPAVVRVALAVASGRCPSFARRSYLSYGNLVELPDAFGFARMRCCCAGTLATNRANLLLIILISPFENPSSDLPSTQPLGQLSRLLRVVCVRSGEHLFVAAVGGYEPFAKLSFDKLHLTAAGCMCPTHSKPKRTKPNQ